MREIENDNKPIARHSYEEHQGNKLKFVVKVIGNMFGSLATYDWGGSKMA